MGKKVKKFKSLPKFKNEDEERDFWDTHDSTDYFDWSKARHVSFPNLKPSSAVVTLRMPQDMVAGDCTPASGGERKSL